MFAGAGLSSAITSDSSTPINDASQLAECLVDALLKELGDNAAARGVVDLVRTFDKHGNATFSLRKTAQYFVTELANSYPEATIDRDLQARNHLLEILSQEVSREIPDSDLGRLANLVSLPWAGIYTTNYDTLIEAALLRAAVDFQVTTRSADLVQHHRDRMEIVKIHGSISELHLDEEVPLVITSDDYAEFSRTRGLLLDELRVNLAQKDFLFLGYGLQDENLDSIIREVSREIKQSPRHLWIQHRGTQFRPDLRHLERRGFTLQQAEDLSAFVDEIVGSIVDFRTSHDEQYLDFAIHDRDFQDTLSDPADFHRVSMNVARELWAATRSGSCPDVTHASEDHTTALYHLLTSKQLEDPVTANEMRRSGLGYWLKEVSLSENLGTIQGFHRTVECLASGSKYFDSSHFRVVRTFLDEGMLEYPDSLTQWLVIQLLERLKRDWGSAEVQDYCLALATAWKEEPDSPVNQKMRPVIARLAMVLGTDGNHEDLLTLDSRTSKGDELFVWELSKFSGQRIRFDRPGESFREMRDGTVVPSSVILDPDALISRGCEDSHPLERRASLRSWLDQAVGENDDRQLSAFLAFEREYLTQCDCTADAVEPCFASFVLLEQLGFESLPDEARRDSQLILAEICAKSLNLTSSGEIASSRASHFCTASVRLLLLNLPQLALDEAWLAADGLTTTHEVLKRLFIRSHRDPWLLENLLNVLAHQIGRPDFHATELSTTKDLVREFLNECERPDRWDGLSPLLRYYFHRSTRALERTP